MKYLTTNEIRELWLEFWKSKNHTELEPKSLIPYEDDSLLFINSGVATLKKYLAGVETPPSKRIVNSQKSLRTNDIENVGVTSRHHTLFEMLGNFSIGDYFKKEAIEYAWELVTSSNYFALDKDKIYITVHPNDTDSFNYWIDLGVDEDKIIKTFDNFWEIGKGPGGPNTEIFFDRGEQYDNRDPRFLLQDDLETDRVVEIWNIVFSQYNCDPTIDQKDYEELPQKNIDTGMGLERMACILQEVETNFETDNFKIIMEEISNITSSTYEENKKAYRIIADHIRALTFAIADGVNPSNEGRGYVLRRLIRRAVKYAYIDLDIKEPILYKLVDSVVIQMNYYYPYLNDNKEIVTQIIKKEEEKFLQTITEGFKYFDKYLSEVENNEFPADKAFKLYDTYGFPFELTEELLLEKQIKVNKEEYNKHLEEQRERARNARKDIKAIDSQNALFNDIDIESEFVGYDVLEIESKILYITDGHNQLDTLKSGAEGYIILDKTPFYATSGGQEKDLGTSESFEVEDVIKLKQGINLHQIKALKDINVDEKVLVKVNIKRRENIAKNHSATHLLHYALNKFLGDDVAQAGSYQDENKTRFDFTSHKEIKEEDILKVQNFVNEQISLATSSSIEEMDIDSARNKGAKALFGEKYGDKVRVVTLGPSIELCGGTHVENLKDINKFFIKSIQSIGSGVYRAEALTDENVELYKEEVQGSIEENLVAKRNSLSNNKLIKFDDLNNVLNILSRLNEVEKTNLDKYKEEIVELQQQNNDLKEQLSNENTNIIKNLVEKITTNIGMKNGVNYIDTTIEENINTKDLKDLSDKILNKIQSGVVILRLTEEEKLSIVIKVSDDLTNKYHAGNMIKEILEPLGGRGGGKPNMAQGGATIKI